MKFFVTIFILYFGLSSVWAELEYSPSYQVDSTVFRAQLNDGEAAFHFKFNNLPFYGNKGGKSVPLSSHVITYSYTGLHENRTAVIGKDNSFEVKLKPGKYSFQFYYDDFHNEITTMDIEARAKHKTFVSCYFEQTQVQIMCEKPVIYLYPEKATDVHVEVLPKGTFTFTYPSYNQGWDVTANPNGELNIHGNSYNYLFWESDQRWKPEQNIFLEGSIVDQENITAFLEARLDEFGLNSKEKADFITFWAPQLIRHKACFIHFMLNDAVDEFAELKISPEPDHIYRIYMISYPVEDYDVSLSKPQYLNKIDRSGFTVIEWGGMIIDNANNREEL